MECSFHALHDRRSGRWREWTLPGGTGTVDGVPAGVWALRAATADGSSFQGIVTTAGGEEHEVSLE